LFFCQEEEEWRETIRVSREREETRGREEKRREQHTEDTQRETEEVVVQDGWHTEKSQCHTLLWTHTTLPPMLHTV
jgi:hypothetical protein